MTSLLLTFMSLITFKAETFFSRLDWPTFKKVNLMMDRNISFRIAYFKDTSKFCILSRKFVNILQHGIRKSAAFNSIHTNE